MSTSGHAAWPSAGTFLSCVALLLFCAGFFRLELTIKDQQTELADLKAQLSALAFQQNSLRIEFVLKEQRRRLDHQRAQLMLQESFQITFVAVELKMKKHESRMDELETQLSRQSAVQKSIVTAVLDSDAEQELNRNKTRTAPIRTRRDASPPPKTSAASIKRQLAESIDTLVTEASLKICANKTAVCLPGPAGPPGRPGSKGQRGSRGRRGSPGRQGAKGRQGVMGPPGRAGKQGIMGPAGPLGQKGQKGKPGPQGIPGVKGEPGESIQAPTVAVSPKSLTVNESEVASMQCSASGNPVPTVVWRKVNGSLPAVRSAVFGSKLVIRSSEGNDSGVYQCEARNILGTSRGQIKLDVNTDPRISLNPGPSYVKVGTNALLPACHVAGHPSPVVTWKRTSRPALPSRVSVTSGNALRIRSVQKSDNDAYTCEASNLLGSHSATTLLVVVELPQFSPKPPSNVTQPLGQTLTLRCGATGDPRPVITWSKEGGQLPAGRSVVSNGQLTIRNVVIQDLGQYVCTAISAGISEVQARTSVVSAVRLTHGHYGRLEVYVSGAWGTVCDDYFHHDLNGANVVCRQLGYSGAVSVHCCAHFGEGSGTTWLDGVRCTGSESSIFNCVHNGYGVENCSHAEDVGVTCST